MPTPEMLSLAAVAISALSLIVAGFAARYTRAAHLKKIADEQPVFWGEARTGKLGWSVDIKVRNLSAADLQCHQIAINRPKWLKIAPYDALLRSDGEGGFRPDYSLLAEKSGRVADMKLSARGSGALCASETFIVHGRPPLPKWRVLLPGMRSASSRSRSCKQMIVFCSSLTWALKDRKSLSRVEQVHITLSAETKPDAAASKIAT